MSFSTAYWNGYNDIYVSCPHKFDSPEYHDWKNEFRRGKEAADRDRLRVFYDNYTAGVGEGDIWH